MIQDHEIFERALIAVAVVIFLIYEAALTIGEAEARVQKRVRIKTLRPTQLPLDKVPQSGRDFLALAAHAILNVLGNLESGVSDVPRAVLKHTMRTGLLNCPSIKSRMTLSRSALSSEVFR
jgi:hypothetical protein